MEAPPPRRQRRSARALALLLLALAAGCCSARDAPSARESKAAAHTKAAARQHRQHHPRHNAAAAALAAALPAPPVAPRRPHVVEANGDARTDDYYWLRDDARTNPDVLAYLKAENDYAAAALNSTAPLRARLYEEMRARVKEQDAGVATRYKGHWYYSRTRAGSQYQTHVRAPAAPGPLTERSAPPALAAGSGDGAAAGAAAAAAAAAEQVLLDEDARRREVGAAFYMLDALEASPDQRLLAWSEDVEGGERYDLYVKDIATGRILDSPVRGTSGSVMWGEDSKTLFYVLKDKLDRPYKVMRRTLGAPPSAPDAVVYEEPDEAFYVSIGRDASERLLYISSGSAVTSEVRYLRSDDPSGSWTVALPRARNVDYALRHHPGPAAAAATAAKEGGSGGGRKGGKGGKGGKATGAGAAASGGDWFVVIMRDDARPNSELLVAPVADPAAQRVLLRHRPGVQIEGAALGARHLIVHERANASTRVVVHALPADGAAPEGELGAGSVIQFDEPVYTLSGGLTGGWDSDVLRLAYNSLTTPASVIDHHIPSGRRALKKAQPVLGGFAASDYASERLWAAAADGARVPISLVYRRELFKKDGGAPMLLYGYGSYGMSTDPTFDSKRLSLLDRGFVFAIAHVRGGGDMGRLWYEDGKYLKKKNTFEDFIACAQFLVDNNYTSPARLAIEGRSAGGMLVGATLNARPDLFNAAIAGVPFVDVLTTMLDESIPLTTTEFDEWGNPKDPKYYSYIKSYSPVDNVRRQRYPHILVTAGLHDPRVGYWEPAKWVAKLRRLKTDGNLLVLKTEMGAGHFSVTGRFDKLKDRALEFAFLLKAAGMEGSVPRPASAAPAEGGRAAYAPAATAAPAAS